MKTTPHFPVKLSCKGCMNNIYLFQRYLQKVKWNKCKDSTTTVCYAFLAAKQNRWLGIKMGCLGEIAPCHWCFLQITQIWLEKTFSVLDVLSLLLAAFHPQQRFGRWFLKTLEPWRLNITKVTFKYYKVRLSPVAAISNFGNFLFFWQVCTWQPFSAQNHKNKIYSNVQNSCLYPLTFTYFFSC